MEKLAYKGGKYEIGNTTKKGKRHNTYCTCNNNYCTFNIGWSDDCNFDRR